MTVRAKCNMLCKLDPTVFQCMSLMRGLALIELHNTETDVMLALTEQNVAVLLLKEDV